MDRIDKQIDLLMTAAQPAPACGAIDALRRIAAKASPEDRRRVLAGLMDFVGRSEGWPDSRARFRTISALCSSVKPGEVRQSVK